MEKCNSQSNFLTACLCKLQLPHSTEHANILPKPVMPVFQLSEEKYLQTDSEHEQTKRVQELLSDVDAARAEELLLQRKFDKDAAELLEAYKEGLKCDHWVPQEFQTSEVDESTMRLKYELEHSKFQLAEARNQLHSLKREMAAYERLAKQEIGDCMDLHDVLTSDRWRGRAQEIKRLKKEIADMESKAYDHKYLKNPLCIPTYKPRFPDVDDLIPREQVRVLQNEARKKRESREKTEKEVAALLDQYGNISLMHKASLSHNKMLAEELRSLKEQLAKYEARAREDKDLMKNLIAHQMQMREMVDREAHLARMVKKKQDGEIDVKDEDVLDAAKYKALLEASEAEKCSLEKMIEILSGRLEDIVGVTEEAERHCEENEKQRLEIEKQIEAQKAEVPSKSKGKTAKTPPQPAKKQKQLPTEAQLAAVRDENKYLRIFLLKAIETKVEDLKLYQLTMNNVREQYVEALKKLKSPPAESSEIKDNKA